MRSLLDIFLGSISRTQTLCRYHILCLDFWKCDYNVSLCVSLKYLTWSFLRFLGICMNAFDQIWENFSHHLFKYPLCPFSFIMSFRNPYNSCVSPLNETPKPLGWLTFVQSFFFSCLDFLITTVLSPVSLTVYITCSHFPLSLSGKVFILVMCSNLQNFFLGLLTDDLYICSYIIFLKFSIPSFNSLRMFIIVVSKSA